MDKAMDKAMDKVIELKKKSKADDLDFPEEIMAGGAGDFANLFSKYLEVPRSFLFMSYLTCLGAMLSKRMRAKTEANSQPRLFVLLLGESADERKSTAITKTVNFFKESFQLNTCWGVGSAEGLQKRLEGDSLLFCLDEFKQFVSKCKIQSSVLLPCVNTLFESNRYESRTKNSDIDLEDAHLSVLAASTIETYESTWDPSFTAIGFNNRLFIVPGGAKRKFSFPMEMPYQDLFLLREQLCKIDGHVGEHLAFGISKEARDVYHSWYMGLERSVHAKRLDGYALRLMSLIAVNELKREIDLATVQRVIALCDWQLDVRKLYDPIDADNSMAKTEEQIRRILKSKGSLSSRDLKRGVGSGRCGIWIFNMSMKNLQTAGEIEYFHQRTDASRKIKMWREKQ